MATPNRFSQTNIDVMQMQNHALRHINRIEELRERFTTPQNPTQNAQYEFRRANSSAYRSRAWVTGRSQTTENAAAIIQRELLSNVHINYDATHHCYDAELHGYHIRYRTPLGRTEDEQNIRQMLTERLIRQYTENPPMPTVTFPPINIPDTTDPSIITDDFSTLAEAIITPRSTRASTLTLAEAPEFTIQQNTQAAELRELRTKYPRTIFEHNLQISPLLALCSERQQVRDALREVRSMKAVMHTLQNTPPKYISSIQRLLVVNFSSRQMREVRNGEITRLTSYNAAMDSLQYYRQRRLGFLADKEQYSQLQAEYNQRSAMIRQRPNRPKIINVQTIVETISQWEKVWGISVKRGISDGLHIRIGLCNIVMEESAINSAYDDPKPITLAPYYFTIHIQNDGSFVCRSTDNNVAGLSHRGQPGTYAYDFHPHQLSDTPCFGSFGQTLIDLSIHGEVVALISGIIAFYSQYNSEDSAGVAARTYHPAHICPISDTVNYTSHLYDRLTRWNFHTVDIDKLNTAVTQYMEYHETERHEAAPECLIRNICYSCEARDVSDNQCYYNTSDGDRICEDCWSHHYCGDCERHQDDCSCDPDEEY